MTDKHSSEQFHDGAPGLGWAVGDSESLRDLIRRLGPPPDDVIECWRASHPGGLPEDLKQWDLDGLGISSSATLVRLDARRLDVRPHGVESTPAVHNDLVQADGVNNESEAEDDVTLKMDVQSHILLAKPNENFSPDSPANSARTVATKSNARGNKKAWLLLGLVAAIVLVVFWAVRPGEEPLVASSGNTSPSAASQDPAPSARSNIFSPDRSRFSPGLSESKSRPTTEPVEALSLIESTDDIAMPELSTVNAGTVSLDPAAFALNSLIPPVQGETKPDADADVNPLLNPILNPLLAPPQSDAAATSSTAAPAPASMDEVLATGDDDPPNEMPQPIRAEVAGNASTESPLTIQADPLPLSMNVSDQQPTWKLNQPIPGSGVRLVIAFDLPDGVNEGWIEPLDETSPRRTRGVAIVTPEDEESVAIGIRMDVRCNAKLSIRMRFAARLDPTLPWQIISRDTLLKSIDYVGSQSLLASSQLTQIESVYSKADTYERRAIRDQRDMAKARVEQYKLLLKRLGELRELADKLESEGKLMVKLTTELPGGTQTLLETVAKAPETQPESEPDKADQSK